MNKTFWTIVGFLIMLVLGILQLYPRDNNFYDLKMSLVQSDQLLVKVQNLKLPQIKVSVNGEAVTDLSYLTFRIKNTGNRAINAEQIKDPIKITFPNESKILTFQTFLFNQDRATSFPLNVTEDEPSNILSFKFSLLNPGEVIGLGLVLDAGTSSISFEEIRLDGRIQDVTDFNLRRMEEQPLLSLTEQKNQIYGDIKYYSVEIGTIIGIVILTAIILLAVSKSYPYLEKFLKKNRIITRYKNWILWILLISGLLIILKNPLSQLLIAVYNLTSLKLN